MATDGAESVVKNFNNKNGRKLTDFTNKEVMLMLHKETKKSISKVDKKLDEHIKWAEKNMENGNKFIHDHDVLIEKITACLPEKGFCEKVTNTLYTEKGEDKVEYLWNDRRWIKYLSMAGFGAIITGMVMIGVSLIT